MQQKLYNKSNIIGNDNQQLFVSLANKTSERKGYLTEFDEPALRESNKYEFNNPANALKTAEFTSTNQQNAKKRLSCFSKDNTHSNALQITAQLLGKATSVQLSPNVNANISYKKNKSNNFSEQIKTVGYPDMVNSNINTQPKSISIQNIDRPTRQQSSNTDRSIDKGMIRNSAIGIFSNQPLQRGIKDGEILIETKQKRMLQDCKSTYLKNRIEKSIDMLKDFRKSTNQHNSFHNAFKYICFEDKEKIQKSILKNKYSEMALMKLQDVDQSDIIDTDLLQDEIETRIKKIEQEELQISRMIDKNKHIIKGKLREDEKRKMQDNDKKDKKNNHPTSYLPKKVAMIVNEPWDEHCVDSINSDIRKLENGIQLSNDRFPKIIKDRHKFYEGHWKNLEPDLYRKATRRDYTTTKIDLFKKAGQTTSKEQRDFGSYLVSTEGETYKKIPSIISVDIWKSNDNIEEPHFRIEGTEINQAFTVAIDEEDFYMQERNQKRMTAIVNSSRKIKNNKPLLMKDYNRKSDFEKFDVNRGQSTNATDDFITKSNFGNNKKNDTFFMGKNGQHKPNLLNVKNLSETAR